MNGLSQPEEVDTTVVNQTVTDYTTDITEAVKATQPKIVEVHVDLTEDQATRQSGVIYSSNDQGTYILTSAAALTNAQKIMVRFDNHISFDAELVGYDVLSDLAVLVTHPTFTAEAIRIGNSDTVNQGEYVMSLSMRSAEMGSGIVSFGIVAGKLQIDNEETIEEESHHAVLSVLASDMMSNEEVIGGPLLNVAGDMIGLLTRRLSSPNISGRYPLAIASSEAQLIAQQLIENGQVDRIYIGVIGRNVEDIEIYEMSNLNLALDTPDGVLVAHVEPESPAEVAGILEGDIITSIKDIPIHNLVDLRNAMYTLTDEEPLSVSILRQTSQINLNVQP